MLLKPGKVSTNIIKLESSFVCLNALVSRTTNLNSKILFVDSPFTEEGIGQLL